MTEIKKTNAAQYHIGNKLHGSKPAARYGIFCDGVEIGFVDRNRYGWTAYVKDATGILRPASSVFSKLAELKKWAASQQVTA
jgi:hypothetical protein